MYFLLYEYLSIYQLQSRLEYLVLNAILQLLVLVSDLARMSSESGKMDVLIQLREKLLQHRTMASLTFGGTTSNGTLTSRHNPT